MKLSVFLQRATLLGVFSLLLYYARRHYTTPAPVSPPPLPIQPGFMTNEGTKPGTIPPVAEADAKWSPLTPLDSPYFCTPDVSNLTKWIATRKKTDFEGNGGEHRADFINLERVRQPTWFCDKVQNSLEPWQYSKYQPSDLAVGVYTGEGLFYSRAAAMADTWLARVPHRLYSAKSEPRVGIQGLEGKYARSKPDWDDGGSAHYTQLYGLLEMYDTFPDAKWYYIVGCDSYLNVDYALRLLDNFDHTRTLAVTPGYWPTDMPPGINTTEWPQWKEGKDKNKFIWGSGSFGWFLTRSMMDEWVVNFRRFDELYDHRNVVCMCPDQITGMVITLMGRSFVNFDHTSFFMSMPAYAADSLTSHGTAIKEFTGYHYVSPRKMIGIDQRIRHEKIDRLVNANDLMSILEVCREVARIHEDRVKQRIEMVNVIANREAVHMDFGDRYTDKYLEQFSNYTMDRLRADLAADPSAQGAQPFTLEDIENDFKEAQKTGDSDGYVAKCRKRVDAHATILRHLQSRVRDAARAAKITVKKDKDIPKCGEKYSYCLPLNATSAK